MSQNVRWRLLISDIELRPPYACAHTYIHIYRNTHPSPHMQHTLHIYTHIYTDTHIYRNTHTGLSQITVLRNKDR